MEAKFWLGSYCNGPGDRDGSLDEGGGEQMDLGSHYGAGVNETR